MSTRYEDGFGELEEIFAEVIQDSFSIYSNIYFKLVFDHKKKVSKGKLIFATIEATSEKTRFLTATEELPDGVDYIIYINKPAWDLADKEDKVRILSHELRHVVIDDKGGFGLCGHDVEDFLEEIKLNAAKPDWNSKLESKLSEYYNYN